MGRPAVDVVVPFKGSAARLADLRSGLAGLRTGPGDSLTIVDNATPGRAPVQAMDGDVRLVRAGQIRTPSFARNRGAELGSGEWLVFIDADVTAPPDLLDRYFDSLPGERTGLLAGAVKDAKVPPGGPGAARYAYIRRFMSQSDTLRFGSWGFPKTANLACRRTAYEEVGGFRDHIRAGEDADLTFRMRAAGWALEQREGAAVVHHNRQTARDFALQKLCHGAGAAWLAREYPGAFPARGRPGLVWWGARHLTGGLLEAARLRDRDRALWAVFDPLELLAHEFGRSLPNERPLSARVMWRHLPNLRDQPSAERLREAGPDLVLDEEGD